MALLERCFQTQAPEDWSEFAGLTYPYVFASVIGATRRLPGQLQNSANDLTQEVYLRLCSNQYANLKKFCGQEPKALAAYLTTVATSVAIDSLRTGSAQKRGEGQVPASLEVAEIYMANADFGPDSVGHRMIWLDIERCLDRTSGNAERDRQIFLLYYREGMAARAIAAVTSGLTAKGVESTLLRLTRSVRDCISPREPQREPQQKNGSAKGNSA